MNSRFLLTLCLAFVLLGLSTGCGGTADDDTTGTRAWR